MRSTVVLSIVLALCGTVAAQPAATPSLPSPSPVTAEPGITAPLPPSPPAAKPVRKRRSDAALLYSIGGTAVSWTVFVAATKLDSERGAAWTLGSIGALGMLTAPSFGHWYAGSHDLGRLSLRALGVALLVADVYGCRHDEEAAACSMPGVFAFGLMFIGGSIYSIAETAHAVRRYNRSLDVTVAPMVGGRGGGNGLVIGGRF